MSACLAGSRRVLVLGHAASHPFSGRIPVEAPPSARLDRAAVEAVVRDAVREGLRQPYGEAFPQSAREVMTEKITLRVMQAFTDAGWVAP